jgi:2-polyprenyl-3-methyl-5-hydroxy-6-metoxy-1,4-benzoquinol methylase
MKDNNSLEGMLSEVLHLITGDKVLDVGTGFGTVVNKLMERPSTRVFSVDPEAWSFATMNDAYEEHIKKGRLSLVKSRIEDLNLGNGEFDTSIALASLHHLEDPVIGIRKMEKLTSGSIIVTDWKGSSAGIHNPHSKDDLSRKERSLKKHAQEEEYSVVDHKYWYMLHKIIEK